VEEKVVDKDFQNGKRISRLIAVHLTDLQAEIRFRISHITWRSKIELQHTSTSTICGNYQNQILMPPNGVNLYTL